MNRNEQIEVLLTKGVEQVLPSSDFLKKELSSGKTLTLYCGYDPNAPTLHIGHAITLRKLRHFQDLGHKIIFLVGDFTARIGDPDKLSVRKPLTEKEVKINLKSYKKQASKFIRFTGKNSAQILFNNKWLGKLKFADIISLASHMTVDQMLKREMFVKRMEEGRPVYVHEFLYPLMQGYDSVAMGVDGEVGGNDQLFNMLMGRTLLKQIKNKEKFVLTMKLLADSDGKKMGKSEGNMIALSDNPYDIYGKVMSWTDGMIVSGFELCTDLSKEEVDKIILGNPRDAKMRLALEITRSVHGEKNALFAQEHFVNTFQKKEIPTDIKEIKNQNSEFQDILLEQKIVSSKGEARRLAEAGAISHLEKDQTLSFEDIKKIPETGTYKIGKNRFIRIN